MSSQGGFSAIICDSMNQLLHIIGSGEGSGYFNYLIIPTDLIVPAGVVVRKKAQGSLGGKCRRQDWWFPCVLFPLLRGSRDPPW